MQQVLRISRKIDYALRAMVHLASVEPGAVVPFREVARKMSVPEDFLAKILKTLVDQGLVRSVRGPRGGYCLGKAASEVSFLDVIEAVEGPVALNVCLSPGESCSRIDQCALHNVWRQGQEQMLEVFRKAKLPDLKDRGSRLPAKAAPGAVQQAG